MNEIIQIVTCDNYDGFQVPTPHLHIFSKINFIILRIILMKLTLG